MNIFKFTLCSILFCALTFTVFTNSNSLHSATQPINTKNISPEALRGKLKLLSFYIKSNQNLVSMCKQALEAKIDSKKKQEISQAVRKLEATNKQLTTLQAQLNKKGLTKAVFTELLAEALKTQNSTQKTSDKIMSYDLPVLIGIAPPGGGPIIPAPGPDDDCKAAGDAVTADCNQALDILEGCGAINPAQKIIGQVTCSTAGAAEENKCTLANFGGKSHDPQELNAATEAQNLCNAIDEATGGGNLQKQTSDGN